MLKLFVLVNILNIGLGDIFLKDYHEDHLSQLAMDIIKKHFTTHKCIVLFSDLDKLESINGSNSSTFIHISFTNFCLNLEANEILINAFDANCDGYVIYVGNPLCVLEMWTATLVKTMARHNPKFLILPIYQTNDFANEIFSFKNTEITSNIVVVELDSNTTNEWPVTLFGNNFNVPVGTEGREGKIFLDRWNVNKGFEYDAELYPDKFVNLNGKPFRVMAFTYLPYCNVDPLDGTEIRLIIEFCQMVNCTIEIVDDGGLWGTIQGNGSGGAGMVFKDEADITLCAIYLWLDNFFYLDYSTSYLYAAVTLLVPKPQPLSGWRVPFLPFDYLMWLCLVLVVLSASYLMYLITRATLRFTRFSEEIERKKQFTTFVDSFILIIGMSVLQQPSIPLVQNSPIRHLFTAFEFFFLIVTSCYSAGLSSYLTVPQFTKPIDTFHELARSGLIWLANHEAWVFTLQHVDDAEVQNVVNSFRVKSAEDLVVYSETGKYGISLERLPAGHFSELPHISDTVISNSHIMAENLYGSPLTSLLKKGSPYTKRLNKLISTLVESGIMLFWEGEVSRHFLNSRKQLALKSAKSTHGSDGPKNLTVDHIQGMFIIYGTGVLVATCCFIWEITSSKRKHKKSEKVKFRE